MVFQLAAILAFGLKLLRVLADRTEGNNQIIRAKKGCHPQIQSGCTTVGHYRAFAGFKLEQSLF